jgi:hypothetical protein
MYVVISAKNSARGLCETIDSTNNCLAVSDRRSVDDAVARRPEGPKTMSEPKFDIFSGELDKDAMWIETVEGLSNARANARDSVTKTGPLFYLFFLQPCRAESDRNLCQSQGNLEKQGPRGLTTRRFPALAVLQAFCIYQATPRVRAQKKGASEGTPLAPQACTK